MEEVHLLGGRFEVMHEKSLSRIINRENESMRGETQIQIKKVLNGDG